MILFAGSFFVFVYFSMYFWSNTFSMEMFRLQKQLLETTDFHERKWISGCNRIVGYQQLNKDYNLIYYKHHKKTTKFFTGFMLLEMIHVTWFMWFKLTRHNLLSRKFGN